MPEGQAVNEAAGLMESLRSCSSQKIPVHCDQNANEAGAQQCHRFAEPHRIVCLLMATPLKFNNSNLVQIQKVLNISYIP